MFIRQVESESDGVTAPAYWFWCPACEVAQDGMGLHRFDNRWTFNGDFKRPTFRASYLAHCLRGGQQFRCHSFVTDGQIQYLADSTHALAGHTINMVEIPEEWF